MIPKIIHYCWFGNNPLPQLALKCIESWKLYLPDYEIKEWNEENFDVRMIPYTAEAYKLKKYAFVSDFARFWILYNFGGIYFDTDVEVIKPLEDIINRGPFMGFEQQEGVSTDNPNGNVAAGLGIGVNKRNPFYKQIIEYYTNDHFVLWNGQTSGNIVLKMTQHLDFVNKKEIGNNIVKVNDIYIYPTDYFCPMNYYTGELKITQNTRSIHHYMASWTNSNKSLYTRVKIRLSNIYVRILSTLKVI